MGWLLPAASPGVGLGQVLIRDSHVTNQGKFPLDCALFQSKQNIINYRATEITMSICLSLLYYRNHKKDQSKEP